MIKEGFSIVMCCYNSAKRLPATLQHIAMLQIPEGVSCELLIIDNSSTDNTSEFVKEEWKKYACDISLKVVNEPLLGLSYARKRGFEEAAYDYVIWCDDDNSLDENYLKVAKEIFDNHKNIGVIGGLGKPYADAQMPTWVEAAKMLAVGKQEEHSGPVKSKRVYGAGAIIFKPAYEKIVAAGFKQLLSDRKGNSLSSGGDYELCYAIAMAGYVIWYDERLTFIHHIPPSRLTYEYYSKLVKESVPCFATLDAYTIMLNGTNVNSRFEFCLYTAKHFFHFNKELVKYSFKAIGTDRKDSYGFFLRSRSRFFFLRSKGLITDFTHIYLNIRKLREFKTRLKALKTD